jgi:hypothetical protein
MPKKRLLKGKKGKKTKLIHSQKSSKQDGRTGEKKKSKN